MGMLLHRVYGGPPRPAPGTGRIRFVVRSPLSSVLSSALLVAGSVGFAPGAGGASEPQGDWPLRPEPEVVATFDPPTQPWGSGHRGVDLAGTVGQTVRSALPGTVSWSGRLAGRGVVVVDHGPTRTTYEPVAGTRRVGTAVAAGGPIGRLEAAGSHCFPRACLHWGWLRGETYLDPLTLVGPRPVRLLPLFPAADWGLDGVPAQARGWAWR